jgi:hypothetical protein
VSSDMFAGEDIIWGNEESCSYRGFLALWVSV